MLTLGVETLVGVARVESVQAQSDFLLAAGCLVAGEFRLGPLELWRQWDWCIRELRLSFWLDTDLLRRGIRA